MKKLTLALVMCAACSPQPAPPQQPSSPPSVDVVELSATDARDRMAAGTLTSEALTAAYLDRIAAVDDGGPMLDVGDRAQRASRRRGTCARCGTQVRQGARAAARHPDSDQGQRRRRRHGELGRLAGAGRPQADGDAFMVDAAARRRRRDSRQDQSQRVGELPLDAFDVGMELARRADEESVRARSQSVRIELRHGHSDCRQPRRHRHRHRNRRQHHLSGRGRRPRRAQADGRSGEPHRHHSDFDLAGHRRARWRARWPTPRCC